MIIIKHECEKCKREYTISNIDSFEKCPFCGASQIDEPKEFIDKLLGNKKENK